MRPVGAPQDAVRIHRDERLGKRHGIAERALAHRHPLRTAHLDPSQGIAAEQIEQRLERALLEAVRGLDPSHVVDDERHVDAPEKIVLRQDVLRIEVQHDVPAQRLDARDQTMEYVQVRHAAQMLDEVEADAANSSRVQARQFRIVDRTLDAGDTAIGALARGNGIQGHVHLRSMAAGMHDHGPGNPQARVQPAQILNRCIGRRIAAIGRIRKSIGRSEHMAVRVACTRRQDERGLDGIRIRRQAAPEGILGRHVHWPNSLA